MARGIARYLRQTATLRRLRGEDGYGQPIHAGPETIRVRKVAAFGRTVNDLGVEVPNRTELLTAVEVSVGDLIDGTAVEGVEERRNRNGAVHHYRVLL